MKPSQFTPRQIIGTRYPDRAFDPAAETSERRAAEGGPRRYGASGPQAHTLERARREAEDLERGE